MMMRSVQVSRFGPPEVMELVDGPPPDPAAGELLVDVEAAEIGFLDTQLRAGWGQQYFQLELPYVPGGGVSGVVRSVGTGVDPSWVGRPVAAGTSGPGVYRGGGYAEQATVPVDQSHPIPDGVRPADSLAALHDGVMVVSRLERAGLTAGDTALITAASGGIGSWLIPLLARAGVTVIAAARGAEKVRLARERGADLAVDYAEDSWVSQVQAEHGQQVDVVFDGAGGRLGTAASTVLRRRGRFFSYGAAAGDFADVEQAAKERDVEVIGIHDDFTADDMRRGAETAMQQLADGLVQPVIGQQRPLAEAAAAHAAIEYRRVSGRSVLLP